MLEQRDLFSQPATSVVAPELTQEDEDRIANKTETILAILTCRPHTSSELIEVTHRFSACIGTLRKQGWIIDGEKFGDGGFLWALRGRDDWVEVTDEMKEAYYQTDHWQMTRNGRMAFDHFACVQCHATKPLEVHHWQYQLFNERIRDLCTLCRGCHQDVHENALIKLHFPHRVDRATADRLSNSR